MDVIKSLTRGPARGVMSSKKGNKNYYKGKGTGRMGSWTSRGRFLVEPWRLRTYCVPDLSGFRLTPYVSPKADQPPRLTHSVVSYFEGTPPASEEPEKTSALWDACYSAAKESQERLRAKKVGVKKASPVVAVTSASSSV